MVELHILGSYMRVLIVVAMAPFPIPGRFSRPTLLFLYSSRAGNFSLKPAERDMSPVLVRRTVSDQILYVRRKVWITSQSTDNYLQKAVKHVLSLKSAIITAVSIQPWTLLC